MPDDTGSGVSTRFKPGHSGNRKGRPRKIAGQVVSPVDELCNRKIMVQLDGAEHEFSLPEALLYKTLQLALTGQPMPIRTILKRILANIAVKAPTTRHSIKQIFHHPKPQSVDEAMLILGIASKVPEALREDRRPQLALEPWAAARGLKRARRALRSEKLIRELKRQVRDPESMVWPAGDEE